MKLQMAEEHIPQADCARHGERYAQDELRTGAGQTVNAPAGAGYAHSDIESAQKHRDHQKKLKGFIGNEIAEFIHVDNLSPACK